MKRVVILPTYNEGPNLIEVVDRILAVDGQLHVLIVDDDSPDGTGVIADNLARRSQRVTVLHRSGPRGRGLAGAEAFTFALKHGYEAIAEMDADLSHAPEYLPQLFAALEGNDVVIGSRFMRGGRCVGRGPVRRCVSAMANAFTRAWLKLPIRDCTSGYRVFTRAALERIGPQRLVSAGPAIVEEVLFLCAANSLRIREVPVTFVDRKFGRSKLGLKTLITVLASFPRFGRLYGR